VGCKQDLRHDQKVIQELAMTSQKPVSETEGDAVKKVIRAERYLECSAKTNEGVREVFEHATRCALMSKKSQKTKKSCSIL